MSDPLIAVGEEPKPVINVLSESIGMDDDGLYIDYIRFLIQLPNGAITISFEHVEHSFRQISDEDLEHAVDEAYLVLTEPKILEHLRQLEGGLVYEIKRDFPDAAWTILPFPEVPMLEQTHIVLPSSIPVEDVLSLYPGCRLVSESTMTIIENYAYHTAKVHVGDDEQTCFFKHVCRKPAANTLDEVKALATLRHLSIVPLFAAVIDPSGAVTGLLFPFAERGNLKSDINQQVPQRQKLHWVRDILAALIYIDELGHTYEDIKASNIVVFADGKARLIDFDGGTTAGHYKPGLLCFGLGVLLEELKCTGDEVEQLALAAKTKRMTLRRFNSILAKFASEMKNNC